MLRHFLDTFLHNFGYISERELILRALPAEKQKRARTIVKRLNSFATMSNVGECLELTGELTSIFREVSPQLKVKDGRAKEAVKLIGGGDQNYRPAMARLFGLFNNNPFGVYAFIARHHWAVRSALSVIRDELSNDGFQLRAQKGTTKKRIDRKSTRLNSSHLKLSRMPSSA